MAETTDIQVVGNVLRRMHASENAATTAEPIPLGRAQSAVANLYAPLVQPSNVTTTAALDGWEALTIVVQDESFVGPLLLQTSPHYTVDYLKEQALDVMKVQWHGGFKRLTKNINWRAVLRPHFTTENLLFGLANIEWYGHAALTGLGDIGGIKTAPDVSELTKYLMTFSEIPYGKELATRALEIDQDLMEEDEGERLSSHSLFSLIRFIQANKPISRPALAAGPGGYLIGRWKSQNNREVNVHFRANGSTTFYASVPDEDIPDQRDFLSASLSVESLAKRLTQLKILGWMR